MLESQKHSFKLLFLQYLNSPHLFPGLKMGVQVMTQSMLPRIFIVTRQIVLSVKLHDKYKELIS